MSHRASHGLRTGVAACGVLAAAFASPALAATPDFGPNVLIFDPTMSVSQIKASVDAISAQQITNQFGTQRYALLFKPGTYGAPGAALNFQVGYYTSVAGLGRLPTDVTIDGSVDVYNQCDSSGCVALNNFWRSLSNLAIKVDNASAGCYAGEFWAVSQAAPMRGVSVNGNVTLMDYCTGPSYASGGFIADSAFQGGTVINGSQQQWFTRNSVLDGWSNGVWNQVFAGVVGAPATCFPATASCGPYTTVALSPVTREAPRLYIDAKGGFNVFAPAAQRNTLGASWSQPTPAPGDSLPISKFYIAKPTDGARAINRALERGLNLILTPGVYALDEAIEVKRPDTIVLGLGFPTLVPQKGDAALEIEPNEGVSVSGVIVDAGPVKSKALLRMGDDDHRQKERSAANPSVLHDVFVRIGGATAGSATYGVLVDSDNAILDDVWIWRADHGAGVGWTSNTADTGLLVDGDNVVAYGLAVEHFQRAETIWNGENGKVFFFQNEMPYDPPSQAAWSEAPGVNGYPALKVAKSVRKFAGYGMGSYSFFNQGVGIFADNAFEVPTTLSSGSLTDLLTIFLNATTGSGGIKNVVNNVGGPSTAANADTPVTVKSYP